MIFGAMPPFDLAAVRGRVPPDPLTRFAPSPTGYLHLGHVANAIWVWGVARALGGRVLLRIEDHDRGRCRTDYEARCARGPGLAGSGPRPGRTRRASSRRLALPPERLRRGLRGGTGAAARARSVYACDCSRRDIALEAGDIFDQETRYPGRCRERGLTEKDGVGVRMVLTEGTETFTDLRLGEMAQSAGETVRRPAPARSRGQLDLPVRGRGGRPAARGGPGDPGRGPAALHRPADPAGQDAGAGTAADVSPPSPDPEGERGQAQQVERRHRRQGAARDRRDAGDGTGPGRVEHRAARSVEADFRGRARRSLHRG